MFGHKSSNQTTVGTAVVQNPSMLDNVSTDDFSGTNESGIDVQQQVQDALNKKEMQTMLDSATSSTPIVANGTFMASPSAPPTAIVEPPADIGVPAVTPVPDPAPDPAVDQTSTDSVESVVQEVSDADIPRPLSAEENKEIESHPIISSVSSQASSDVSNGDAEVASPSAPIDPPPAPAAVVADPEPEPTEPAVDDSAEATPAEDVTATTESPDEPTTEIAAPVEDPPAETQEEVVATEETVVESEQVDSPAEEKSAPEIDTDKLAGMKQQALEHLEPLVDHLDQTPEEEFRTTMMRIQANDNHTLLERAFDAAKKITDDKERAQAMLDIVNEINYFSQKN